MAKTLADLYCEVGGSEELLKAFAEAAKAGTVLDFVKANGVETTEEEIQNFRATEGKLSVDELANAAGGGGCKDKCDHNWVFAATDPAMDIGGDFYDFFLLDHDHLALVIADVSGKGMSAALFMMSTKTMISGTAFMGGTPAEILDFVNRQICRTNKANMFVTVWMGILEISTGRLTASSAGHEYPMLLRSGRYEMVRDQHGMGLGMFDAAKYTNYELTLQRGDGLFVYTDGVAEAAEANEALFGTDRTLEAHNADPGASPEQVLKNVRAAIDGFVKEAPQFDDLTMLCLRYNGPESGTAESPAVGEPRTL